MSRSVQQALALSGEGSEALADSEIQSMIQSHIKNLVAENIVNEQSQKTNLEDHTLLNLDEKVSNFLSQSKHLYQKESYSTLTHDSIFLIINYIKFKPFLTK